MNALQVMYRYQKEVIQASTRKHDINVQYLFDITNVCKWFSFICRMIGGSTQKIFNT